MSTAATATDPDCAKFKQWAARMGCPLQLLPTDDVLRRTFTTAQGRRLMQVTRRVAPATEIRDARHQILLAQLAHYRRTESTVTTAAIRHQLPAQIQRLIRVRELRSASDRLRQQIAAKREQLDALRLRQAEAGRHSVRLAAEVRCSRAKAAMLAAKLRSLDAAQEQERRIAETVAQLMPVQYCAGQHSEAQAQEAIRATCAAIRAHYGESAADAAPTALRASGELWTRLAQPVRMVPNSLLWAEISRAQQRNVARLRELCADAARSRHNLNAAAAAHAHTPQAPAPRSQLAQFLTRARCQHIGIQLRLATATAQLDTAYAESEQPTEAFMQRVHAQAKLAAGAKADGGYDQAVVDEYIAEYTASLYNRGQLDWIRAEVAQKQREYETGCSRLGDHAVLLGSLQAVYAEAERTVNETRDASSALYAIREKLQWLEAGMRALVLEARGGMGGGQQQQQRRALNGTLGGGGGGSSSMLMVGGGGMMDTTVGSFNLSQNSDLCSTRLEDNLQVSMVDNRAGFGHPSPMKAPKLTYAQHVAELNAYLECPQMALISQTALSDTIQQLGTDKLVPHHPLLQTDLYRAAALLDRVACDAQWHSQLAALLAEQQVSIRLAPLDASALAAQRREQLDRLAELRDQCDTVATAVQQKQQLADRLCAFMLDNSLRQFIPRSKTFNERTYQDYERDYMLLYEMVVRGGEEAAAGGGNGGGGGGAGTGAGGGGSRKE